MSDSILPDSPGSRNAGVIRDVLERVLLELRRLPTYVDRRAIVDALEATLAALTTLEGSRLRDVDHFEKFEAVERRVTEARVMLGVRDLGEKGERLRRTVRSIEASLEACRAETIDSIVAVQSESREADVSDHQVVWPFGASLGTPRLFRLRRGPIETFVDVSAIDRLDTTTDLPLPDDAVSMVEHVSSLDEELAAEAARSLRMVADESDGAPRRFHQSIFANEPDPERELDVTEPGLGGEQATLRRIAHDCLIELGALGNLRAFDEETRFAPHLFGTDARLLASLDALVALGESFVSSGDGAVRAGLDVPAETLAFARAAYAGDTVRPFARAFVLGCIAGDDAVRAAVLGLNQSLRYAHEAQSRAFILGSSPAIDPAMRRLVGSDDAALSVVALEVLTARASGEFAGLVAVLEHPSELVRVAAAACLATVPERDAACSLLERALATESSEEVLVAFAEALALLGSLRGLPTLRDLLGEELVESSTLAAPIRRRALELLAIAGTADDAGLLVRLHAHGIDTSTALGWHGHLGNVGPLLETLSVGGGVAGPRMRRAAARALVRIVGGPVPSQEDGSPLDRYEPVTDFADWADWWQENAPRFEPSRRYRFGVPFAPEAPFQELTSEGVPLGARRLAALELGLWSGGRRVDVRDWFARQLVHASEARHRLHESVAVPGTFWGDNRA